MAIKVKTPAGVWIEVSKYTTTHGYKDGLGPSLLIVVDELAELSVKSGGASPEQKAEDEMRAEIMYIIQSITQLGRSAGIHMALVTQRNDAKILPGVIQNNPLATDTKIRVLRKVEA